MNKNVTSLDLILNKGKQLGWSTNHPAFNIKKEKREHHRSRFLKIELSLSFLRFCNIHWSNMDTTLENLKIFIAIVCIMFIILGIGCLCCSIYCSISSVECPDEPSTSPRIRRSRLQTQRRHMGEDHSAQNKVPSAKTKGGSNKRPQSRRISFA